MNIFQRSSRDIGLLIYLAQRCTIDREAELTTTQIAKYFGISQQSASRCLIQAHDEGLIIWASDPKGSKVRLTHLGLSLLHKLRYELERALHPEHTFIILKGKIFSGLGEGRYYISRPPYMDSFQSKLGYQPFPGTLNIRIRSEDSNFLDLIKGSWPVVIPGFKEKERRFGDVLCYPARIPKLKAKVAIIIPRRTHYGENILELISDVCLRKALALEDGDEIEFEYPLKQNKE